jgi:hypothetical protein
MPNLEPLRTTIIETHAWFESTLSDVTEEQAHWQPPGIANPIVAVYAHVVVGADFGLNTILNSRQPLIVTGWDSRAGLSELMPLGDWHDWATNVHMDLDVFRKYAQTVYQGWSGYLAFLSEADLESEIDLSSFDMGTRRLAMYLTMQIQHFSSHTGEISCLKGLQGEIGYRASTADGRD